MLRCFVFVLLVCYFQSVVANTEKVIFRAPREHTQYTSNLPVLAAEGTTRIGRLVYSLSTPFSLHDKSDTTEQWFLLDDLGNGWTYEVRLCWPAIMPTTFDLDIFTGAEYEKINGFTLTHAQDTGLGSRQMFLRVRAKPGFVSHIKGVMQNTPVVDFELVMDPLVFRAIPRSLLGTITLTLGAILIGIKLVSPRVLSVIEEQVKERRQKVVRIKTH